jgi:hypothetical protein
MKNDKGGQMKDLDFDELHEAVNKLMVQAQKPKAKREPAKSIAKAVSRPSVKVAERTAKDDTPEKQASTPAEEDATPVNITVRTKPAAKVLPKKRGMAMDVVQAAKPGAVAPPSARAARTAPTLQPTGPVAPEPPKPRETTITAPQPEPLAPTEPNDVSDDTLASLNMQTEGEDTQKKTLFEDDKPAQSAFPDPLEVHGFTDEKDEVEEPAPQVEPAPQPAKHDPLLDDTDDQPVKNDWHMPETSSEPPVTETAPVEPEPQAAPAELPVEPPATPFLNTKVEKRPLGSFAAATSTPAASAQPTLTKTDDPVVAPASGASEQKPEPAAIETPATPAELKPEIVAVESAETDYAKAGWEKPRDDEPVGDLRQMSIPQQHHGHDKEPAKSERPVFDTKNYHPPLQPVATAKHHSGSKAGAILTVILIILLVAAGVGAYFVATGSIDLTNLL